jgi:hypothetical protein
MIFKTYAMYKTLCEHCFLALQPLNKRRKEFFVSVLWLFLSIKGKINFLQLERYGENCEQTSRNQFQEGFEFLPFNAALVSKHCSARTVIGFDPTYLPKSGKKTEGVGKFWSGCAGASKWGLEISGIAAIDLDNHTAMHLEAVQTLPEDGETLLEFYAKILIDRKDELQKISNVVVADAYFSKETFVTLLCLVGFQVVSRLRDDVRMTYIIEPVKTGKPGRTKTVGDKVDVKNLDLSYFTKVATDNPEETIYTAIVKATALKRNIRVVIVQKHKNGKVDDAKIYFSTDTEMSAEETLEIYRTRFQAEFLYRDAKQHTGLTNCQARSKEKLHFHCNMSLTAVSVAKAVHWLSIPKEKRKAFSMANVKTMNHNALLLKRFLCVFGVKANLLKNNQIVKELLLYGTIAA